VGIRFVLRFGLPHSYLAHNAIHLDHNQVSVFITEVTLANICFDQGDKRSQSHRIGLDSLVGS